MSYQLTITNPSADAPLIAYAAHFAVAGRIRHTEPVPEDAVLTVALFDRDGRRLRYTRQTKKNDRTLYTDHPDLTRYRDALDPTLSGLKDFGFPELLVKDLVEPMASMRDATIKCFYSDDVFKSFIVSATDTAHGLILDDGVGFTDEKGMPYHVLPCGTYTVTVTLDTADGERLAEAEKSITIGHRKNQALCRFNPRSHKARMIRWCEEIGCDIMNDDLPGYLDAYLGTWYYHMGLLPMYRASDIALYTEAKIHMFVYLTDPTSTSYETELAFLQTRGAVGDPERFAAYHYDIGEAVLDEGTEDEKHARIVAFDDSKLALCRVDAVRDNVTENVYELNGSGTVRAMTALDRVTACVGERLAVMGVVCPWQMNPADFVLRRENVYDIYNRVEKIRYEFDDGTTCERTLMLERTDCGQPIGRSVFEFYHLFTVPASWRGRDVHATLYAVDLHGAVNPSAMATLAVRVKA